MTGLQFTLTDNGGYDFLLDIKTENGRITQGICLGETTPQNQAFILVAHKGDFKENPMLGVGIGDIVNDHDFDRLQKLDLLRSQLLQDEFFDTQLLFRSPSGDGLKWVIEIDLSQTSHADYFRAVANYIQSTYGVEVDKSGKDISRACFLPYDPQCFINQKYLE